MIELMLPPGVAGADRFGDDGVEPLFPEEAVAVSCAVDSRRREFATGRACARAALRQLGLPPVAIVRGRRGFASWPDDVTGSITHCAGYRAAAVARSDDALALGIDAEPNEPLPDSVLPLVSSAAERDRMSRLASGSVCWDRLLFSAKESVYKAWFPLTARWLDFSEADVVFGTDATADPAGCRGTFVARLLVPGPVVGNSTLQSFTGEWLSGNGFLLTTIVVPATPLDVVHPYSSTLTGGSPVGAQAP